MQQEKQLNQTTPIQQLIIKNDERAKDIHAITE